MRLGTLLLPVVIAAAADGQWTQFRGPNGSGVGFGSTYPVEFSPSKNVVWKKAVPFGQSSPVVSGARVYVTASEGDKLLTICFDAKTGTELWRREIRRKQGHKIDEFAIARTAAARKSVATKGSRRKKK